MPGVFYLESLGCARNQVDSETLLAMLAEAGWRIADDPAEAEVIAVNTCGFIEAATNESIDTILGLARYKTEGACRRLIALGCAPQRYGKSMAEAMPEVDIFLGTGALDRIVTAAEGGLAETFLMPPPEGCRLPPVRPHRFASTGHSVYIKIAEGCLRHCTYCIIPKLRGRQRSRPPEAVLAQASAMVAAGARELVLVAQDSTAYGLDLGQDLDGKPPTDLGRLLELLSGLSRDIWLRVLYGHPESLSDSIIETMARLPNVCAYYDAPIQHASDTVLRRMGRRYTAADLGRLFGRIRNIDPEAVLRTTAIVGFPGETAKDFDALMDFVAATRFDHLGVFTYSDAEDLPSHGLPNPVSARTARRRHDRLMELQRGISEERCGRFLDRTLRVLVEEAPEPGVWIGRSAFQAPEVDGVVYIRGDGAPIVGQFIDVRIADTLEYDLVGEIA